MPKEPLLEVNNIEVRYNEIPAIFDASFKIEAGQIVALVGSNGAGKTTILKTISGLLHNTKGEIKFLGSKIDGQLPHHIAALGISHVPEGRGLFGKLTVVENLLLGAYTRKSELEITETLEEVFQLFPILKERTGQKAETMSGGEQQMLAVARGLMPKPKLLMLDEPSLGLMPTMVDKVIDVIKIISKRGTTILLVEQAVRDALELADKAYVLQNGRTVLEGTGEELLNSDLVKKAYLGM